MNGELQSHIHYPKISFHETIWMSRSFLFIGFYLCGRGLAKQMKAANKIGREMFSELKRTNHSVAPGKYPITVKYGFPRVLLIGTCY